MSIEWGQKFPNMDAHPTQDKRVFQTLWKKQGTAYDAPKEKLYFCCVAGGDGNNCYGITVTRQWATNATKECLDARAKVSAAADHYEEHRLWPAQDKNE